MGRVLAIGTLAMMLSGCGLATNGRWDAWAQAQRQPLGRGVIGAPEQVIENRVRWRGHDDLHAEILMTLTREDQLSVVARIIDDRPLQQSRSAQVHPAWWLQRVGCDAMEVIVGEGEDAFSVIAALGSAGIDPAIIEGARGDEVAVFPTPTGAEVQVLVDLGARGMIVTEAVGEVRVRLHDADGPGDWSVHEVALR